MDRLFSQKEVVAITRLAPRQIAAWSEKMLVPAAAPARKAGTRRGFSRRNCLEFALARHLIDVIGVQFFTAKRIMDSLRESGDLDLWLSDSEGYVHSFTQKFLKAGEDYGSASMAVWSEKATNLGGTVNKRTLRRLPKAKAEDGTLWWLLGIERDVANQIHILSPWNFQNAIEVFNRFDLREWLPVFNGGVVINVGALKGEIDERIQKVAPK
jgi:hypothetical protein